MERTSSDGMDPHFLSLVLSLSSAAMQQLGKVPNPLTGKIEKNLVQAGMTIDMLGMIREKTEGNRPVDESKLIMNALSDLRLNYADEVAKQEAEKAAAGESAGPQQPETA